MEEKKYEILMDEEHTTMTHNGIAIHRIRATRDFADVKKGDIGGYVESERNLSQEGNCWIYNDAVCYGNARVSDNASITNNVSVYDNACVYGNAIVADNCCITNNAIIKDNTKLNDRCIIGDNASISDNAIICGFWKITDNSKVFGDVVLNGDTNYISENTQVFGSIFISASGLKMSGDTSICGNMSLYPPIATRIENGRIKDLHDYLFIGPVGNDGQVCSFYKSHGISHDLCVSIDRETCGSIYDIEGYVKDNYTWREYEGDFKIAIELAKKYFNIKDSE